MVLLSAIAGCSDDSTSEAGGSSDALGGGDPVVSIRRPTSGESFDVALAASGVPVELDVQGLSLTAGGDGIRLTLDGVEVETIFDNASTLAVPDPGLHTLEAQAVQPDGTPYVAATAVDTVQFSVVVACSADAECADTNPCSTELCIEGVCSYKQVTGCCVTAAECGDGALCVNNVCESKDSLLCKTDSDCTGKLVSATVLGPCQLEACVGGACELTVRDGLPCDDGDACTGSGTCDGTVCTHGPALACDDGDPCTDDACVQGQCTGTPNTATCDDGDPCTFDDFCGDGVCEGTPDPECVPPLGDTICVVTGAKGDEVACPVRLVRLDATVALPAALQLQVLYDAQHLQFVRFEDESCIAGPCQLMPTPPTPLWPTGHTVSQTPGDPANWSGKGTIVVANVSDPTAAITEAWLDADGVVQGDPQFVQAVFVRKTEGTDPVTLAKVVVSNAAAEEIPSVVSNQRIEIGDAATSIADAACSLIGGMQDQIDCPIRLAAESASVPPATALEMVLGYPTDRVRIIGFFDELCFDQVGCFDQAVAGPGALPLSTGHQVSIAPTSFDAWAGSGAAIIVHPGAPYTELTDAFYNESGALVGDPIVLRVRFELLSPAPASAPVLITLGELSAADADAFSLPVTLQDGIIVSGAPK